jgi:hypothetical protein
MLFFNISYAPFNKSTWFQLRSEIVNHFLTHETPAHPLFQLHKHAIARDFGMKLDSQDDDMSLFRALASMPSLKKKGPHTKLMKWFSWFEAANFHMAEFNAWAFLFTYYLVDLKHKNLDKVDMAIEEHADPQAQIRALKAKSGTMELLPRILTQDNFTHAKLLMTCMAPIWTSHADRARHCKTQQAPTHWLFGMMLLCLCTFDVCFRFSPQCFRFCVVSTRTGCKMQLHTAGEDGCMS